MESISTRPATPIAAPTRNTGPLRPVETAQPTVPAESYQDNARRGSLMNEASQFEYGDMPWGADKPAKRELSSEDLERVIGDHVADPCKIGQSSQYTCVATTMQRWLACNQGDAYKKLVTDLQTKGSATLPNGDTLHVSEENLAKIARQNLLPEMHIDLLMQTAIMEYANGDANYDVETGQSDNGRAGLNSEEAQAVFEKIAGKHTLFVKDIQGFENYDAFIADLKAKTEKGQYVCLPLNQNEVSARQSAMNLLDQAAHAEINSYMDMDGHRASDNQYMAEAQQALQDAEFTGQMAHLVEIAEVDDLGNVTAFDPREKNFVKMTKAQFIEALQAAMGDDLGGTLSYSSTSQSKPAPRRPPAPPPPPPGSRS